MSEWTSTWRLCAELEGIHARGSLVEQVREGEIHCVACGRTVPKAPFCQQCGCLQPLVLVCLECGEKSVLPVHFLPGGASFAKQLFCAVCGSVLTAQVHLPRAGVEDSGKDVAPKEVQ